MLPINPCGHSEHVVQFSKLLVKNCQNQTEKTSGLFSQNSKTVNFSNHQCEPTTASKWKTETPMSPHGPAEYFYRRKFAKIEGGIISKFELQNTLCNLQKTLCTLQKASRRFQFWAKSSILAKPRIAISLCGHSEHVVQFSKLLVKNCENQTEKTSGLLLVKRRKQLKSQIISVSEPLHQN